MMALQILYAVGQLAAALTMTTLASTNAVHKVRSAASQSLVDQSENAAKQVNDAIQTPTTVPAAYLAVQLPTR